MHFRFVSSRGRGEGANTEQKCGSGGERGARSRFRCKHTKPLKCRLRKDRQEAFEHSVSFNREDRGDVKVIATIGKSLGWRQKVQRRFAVFFARKAHSNNSEHVPV